MSDQNPLLPDPSKPLNLRPVSASSTSSAPPFVHPAPQPSSIKPWQFAYAPSHDGHESNLLIMFHGLGDTEKSFAELGRNLKLPGTCVMSVRGLYGIPMMDFPCFSWFPLDFSASYAPSAPPNPATLTPKLIELVRYLVEEIGWDLERIHLFGWGEGGTAVLELAREVGVKGIEVRRGMDKADNVDAVEGSSEVVTTGTRLTKRFGSAISICGPLLSTLSITSTALALTTPVLYFHRPPTPTTPTPTSLNKTFSEITHLTGSYNRASVTESLRGGQAMDGRMLTGKEEWMGVMKFWGQVLVPADEKGWMKGLRGKDGLGEMYEVVR